MAGLKNIEAVRKSGRSIKPKASGQLSIVESIIETSNVKHNFDNLPPVYDYHFVEVGRSRFVDKNTHELRLYLGQNASRRTWAYLKYWPLSTNKGSQVVFVNETPMGDIEAVKEFANMALMYPFRVFKERFTTQSMRRLSHFVQYVYLYSRKVDKVFADSLVTVEEVLIPAVGIINSVYQSKGGVQVIPDCHVPGPFNDPTYNDDQITPPQANTRSTRARPGGLIAKLRVSPDILAPESDQGPSNSKGKGRAFPDPHPLATTTLGPRLPTPSPLGHLQQEEDTQTVISEGMSNMDLGALTSVTNVIDRSKRKADSEDRPFEHWKRLKLEKQKEARREKLLIKQLKEVQTRQARYDSEMEVVAKEQPVETIIRWAAADVREDSEEDGEVNPVVDEH